MNTGSGHWSISGQWYKLCRFFFSTYLLVKVSAHVGTCRRDMLQQHVAATKSCVVHTEGTFSRDDFAAVLSLRHVARISTRWTACNKLQGQNRARIRVTRAKNYQHTRGDVWLRHVPATFSCVRTHCDWVAATCPRYSTLLHVLSVWTTHNFVAALCRCDMSLRLVRTFKVRIHTGE